MPFLKTRGAKPRQSDANELEPTFIGWKGPVIVQEDPLDAHRPAWLSQEGRPIEPGYSGDEWHQTRYNPRSPNAFYTKLIIMVAVIFEVVAVWILYVRPMNVMPIMILAVLAFIVAYVLPRLISAWTWAYFRVGVLAVSLFLLIVPVAHAYILQH